MTVLVNSTRITARPQDVWAVLASLDALADYDPGVKASAVISAQDHGLGASRRCTLSPAGWLEETVIAWEPGTAVAFELTRCSLPVNALRHDYTLMADGETTVVEQRMTYELKYGAFGRILDSLIMRRKWDSSIKVFLAGLTQHVEAQARAATDGT